MVIQLLKGAIIRAAATAKGFLIDGYPLDETQAKRFESEV